MNYVDLIIAAIFVFYLISGYTRGLILSLVYLLRYIVAFLVAREYFRPFTIVLMDQATFLSDWREQMVVSFESFLTTDTGLEGLPRMAQRLIADRGVAFAEVPGFLADLLVEGLGFLLLFFLAMLLITLVGHLVNGFFELPLLKDVNRLAGMLFGVLRAGVFVMILVAVITVFSPVFGWAELQADIAASTAGQFFYHNNLVMYLVYTYL
jgi:uncharacterized membrane protein required for colicin V production